MKPEAYLELVKHPRQSIFAKIVNDFQPLLAADYFCKKTPSWIVSTLGNLQILEGYIPSCLPSQQKQNERQDARRIQKANNNKSNYLYVPAKLEFNKFSIINSKISIPGNNANHQQIMKSHSTLSTPFHKTPLIFLMSAFFLQKIKIFLANSDSMRAVLEIFQFSFCTKKGSY